MIRLHLIILLLSICQVACSYAQTPSPPTGVEAHAYDSHVELNWASTANASAYKIYRSADGGLQFSLIKQVPGTIRAYLDWVGDEGTNLSRQYYITAISANGQESAASNTVSALIQPASDSALLEMVQQYTFRYFWDFGHPVSGMARERSNGDGNTVTTGGSGFGIMAIVVGAERNWVSRQDAVDRLLKIVSFLQFADRFHGVFPHWMHGGNGNVIPFSQYDNGADLVETAFLMQGLLTARQYFNQDTPAENSLRSIITGLWEEVEWDWFRKNNGPVLYWHWSPDFAWQMNFPLRGFYEAQIVYILAAASPTHPVPASLYQSGWTSSNYANTATHFGYPIYCGPFGGGPLFFAHYSYLGFDPRNKKDAFCNYFNRNRNHSLIQKQYCSINPENHAGYSATCWGLTASDNPWGYGAHDIWPSNDNGTISPTAALSSMPYTPDESLAALKHFYRVLGQDIWGLYGFYDAFNQGAQWVAPSYLAIDQGPIIAMIENQRSGLLWDHFMSNPEIQPALDAIGFIPDFVAADEPETAALNLVAKVLPTVVAANTPVQLSLELDAPGRLSAYLFRAGGTFVEPLFTDEYFIKGRHTRQILLKKTNSGMYFIQIQHDKKQTILLKLILE